jgi:hypothetical protein
MSIFSRVPNRFYKCNNGKYSDHARRGACNYNGGLKSNEPVKLSRADSKQQQQYQAGQVLMVPVQAINVRREWFQGRATPYSERSVENITKAVQVGKFRWSNMDPVTLWAGPDGKLYMLSGHSRLEAFTRLCEASAVADGRNFCEIPAKIETNITLQQAKEIALQSNTLSTKETTLERAAYYAALREKGANDKSLLDHAKQLEGKNYTTVLAFSHLNPAGRTYAALLALDKGETDSSNIIANVGRWIGNARKFYPALTNFHENELYDWLINRRGYGTGSAQVSNEKEFKERLASVINRRTTFGVLEDSLNIQAFLQRSPVEQQYDAQLTAARKEVTELDNQLKAKIKDLTARDATSAQIEEITRPLEISLRRARVAYQEMVNKRGDVAAAARNELSLFAGIGKIYNSPYIGKNKELTHAELLQFIDAICSPQCFSASLEDCECKCDGRYHAASQDAAAYRRLITDLRKVVSISGLGATPPSGLGSITHVSPPGVTPCADGKFSTYPLGRGVCSYHGGGMFSRPKGKPAQQLPVVAPPPSPLDRFPGAAKKTDAIPYCNDRNFSSIQTFEYVRSELKKLGIKHSYRTQTASNSKSVVYWEIKTDVKLFDENGRPDDVLRMVIYNGGSGGTTPAIRIIGIYGGDFLCATVPQAVEEFAKAYNSSLPPNAAEKKEKNLAVAKKVLDAAKSRRDRIINNFPSQDKQSLENALYINNLKIKEAENYIKKHSPEVEPEVEPEEELKNYFVINEDQKYQLHFDYQDYKNLPQDKQREIKKYFLWSRGKKAWISKGKEGNWSANAVIKDLGLERKGRLERRSFADTMNRQQNRAEYKADRLEVRSAKAEQRAEALQAEFNKYRKDWSWLTQPNVNSSGGRRFSRQREGVMNRYDKGMRERIYSDQLASRAADLRASLENPKDENITFVLRRINDADKRVNQLQQDIEKLFKVVDTYKETGVKPSERYDDDRAKDTLEKWLYELNFETDKLSYYLAKKAELEGQGVKVFTKENLTGAQYVARGGSWHKVIKLNAKTVTHSWFVGAWKSPYIDITDAVFAGDNYTVSDTHVKGLFKVLKQSALSGNVRRKNLSI